LTVVDSAGDQETATLDAEEGESGWNSVGTFQIADGETRVELSDVVDGGRFVIADAIRWTPAR
ncbi:MAG: hypothetical protein GY711_18095, partial [bacterium]|nr:hypothetical protein [bacterium]